MIQPVSRAAPDDVRRQADIVYVASLKVWNESGELELNREAIKTEWSKNGYVVVPQLWDAARVKELKIICDSIFDQWLEHSATPEEAANYTNMAFLTEPRYFTKHPERLKLLLNAIADEKALDILSYILDCEPLFHNTQYFFNPAGDARGGDWHRDQQFGAEDEETEKSRMRKIIAIHLHVAFLPDDNLEYVPGSHARWDTPEELEIRRGLNGRGKNAADMPGARRINLDAGDGVFFGAWGIHRGNYRADMPRRTFDIIYGSSPADWYTPPPTCFLQPDVLEGLTPQAQAFFRRFIETYKDNWLKGQYDL